MHTLLWVFIVGLGSGVLFHCFVIARGSEDEHDAALAGFRALHAKSTLPGTPPHRSRTTFLKCTLKFIDKAGTGPNNAAYPP